MAYRDLIVDEIRKIRDEHAAKFNYNLRAIFADIKRRESEAKKCGVKYVTLKPRRVKPVKAVSAATRGSKNRRRAA